MSNEAIDAILHDEHAGKGGSYIYDPETGKRTLVDDAPPASTDSVFRELAEKE